MAGLMYQYNEDGRLELVRMKPEPPPVPQQGKWEPKLGEDRRDNRNPQTVGKRLMARRRKREAT